MLPIAAIPAAIKRALKASVSIFVKFVCKVNFFWYLQSVASVPLLQMLSLVVVGDVPVASGVAVADVAVVAVA